MTPPAAIAQDAMVRIGRRLDRLPILPFHHRLLLMVGAGLLVDGVDVYLTAGVAGALVRQHVIGLGQVAQLAIATSVGLGVGGLACGFLADGFGRRRIMQWTILLVLLGSLGAALSPDFTWLLAWRLVTCLGLGGETVLGYAMIGEFAPPAWRGRWMARLGFIANLGMPCSLLLGLLVLPHAEGWRVLLAIPGLGAVAVFLLRLKLPESPRWLAARGREGEAELVVARIEATSPTSLPPAPAEAGPGPAVIARPRLLGRANLPRLAVGFAVNIAIMSAIFGFVTWLPTFFAAGGASVTRSVGFAAIISLGGPAGTLIGLAVTDRIERKWGVVVSSILAVAFGALYAMAREPWLILTAGFLQVTLIYVFGTLGLVSYVPELFATGLRMKAIGICATAGRIVIMLLPLAIVPVFSRAGQAGVIGLVGVILLIQAAVVAVLGVPTRGRSLEAV